MGVHLVPAPPEPLLTGAANLAALPSAASNRNVIAKTADGGAYISDGTTWQQISPPTGTYAPVLTDAQTITYNADGTVATVTLNGVTTTYTYNTDGTVATETRGGVTRTYTYTSGNLTAVT